MLKVLLLLLMVLWVAACVSDDIDANNSPQSAAERFLFLIDQGNYRESWAEASTFLRSNVDAEQWTAHAGSYRQPLGNVAHREFKSIEFHYALEDMPAGDYAFVFFDSSLADNGKVSEMVGLMLDEDATWRVIGYQAN